MADEDQHLAEADRHISVAEERLTEQEALLEAMNEEGLDTGEAEKLLANLKGTLEQMYIHRQLILEEIARKS